MEAPSPSISQSIGEDSSADVRTTPRWLNKRVGRFRLLQMLGKGSFGRVFLAQDIDLERRVALKILTADATAKRLRRTGSRKFMKRKAGQDHFNSRDRGVTTMGKRRDIGLHEADRRQAEKLLPYS